MDETKLSEWEQLAEKATPGPWEIVKRNINAKHWHLLARANTDYYPFVDTWTNKDAAFIAASRTAVPELCAEVRRLAAEIERRQAEKKELCKWTHDMDDLEYGVWYTGCDNAVMFDEDTPAGNGYKFCHYCGKLIDFVVIDSRIEE